MRKGKKFPLLKVNSTKLDCKKASSYHVTDGICKGLLALKTPCSKNFKNFEHNLSPVRQSR